MARRKGGGGGGAAGIQQGKAHKKIGDKNLYGKKG
eukprot:SAG31_NODE_329_length_17643_cov_10.377793_1_plen_34_part_10